MAEEHEYQRGVSVASVEQIENLLFRLLRISSLWVAVVIAATILSAFDFSRDANGDLSVGFHVTTTTVLLLSLVWLPGLIRVIALTGGKFKTAAGEATTSGLLDIFRDLPPDAKREALPPVIAAVDMAAGEKPLERVVAREARDDLESQLAAAGPTSIDPKGVLRRYAERYEKLREELDSGPERTFQMNALLAEARAAAKAARLSGEDIKEFFASDRPGLRLMAIASLQVNPDASAFECLLAAISNSFSAFEQYHALAAARDHVHLLSGTQRKKLREVLEHQLEEPVKGIQDDSSRNREVQALLAQL